jgi:glycine/D-amino acid oxidase-like deaminating enzyme
MLASVEAKRMQTAEVVIIGGGIVGSSIAWLLGRAGGEEAQILASVE